MLRREHVSLAFFKKQKDPKSQANGRQSLQESYEVKEERENILGARSQLTCPHHWREAWANSPQGWNCPSHFASVPLDGEVFQEFRASGAAEDGGISRTHLCWGKRTSRARCLHKNNFVHPVSWCRGSEIVRQSGFQPLYCPGPLSTLKDALWAENPNMPLQLMDGWSPLCGVLMIFVAILPPVPSTKPSSP